MRRNCCRVISEMIKHIPLDRKNFISDLEWNYNDASYKAPEENIQWERTQETLMKHISEPSEKTEEWEFEVLSIFSTKTVEELKEYYEV